MLAGYHPPEGEEVTVLSFRGSAWQRVSREAKDLLLGVLRHDPEERLSLDDVIEHPWLQVPWRAGSVPPPTTGSEDVPMSRGTSFLNLPPPRTVDTEDKDDAANSASASTEFQSAFPEAPAASCASKIPAGSPGSSPQKVSQQGTGAPGWGNVFSWLRANAAAAEAQKVLSQAGMASVTSATFGRTPLVPQQPQLRPTTETDGARESDDKPMGPANLVGHNTSESAPQELPSGDGSNSGPAGKSAPGHIQWVTCAPRFASTWRFAQGGVTPPPSPLPCPSPCPSPPPSPWDELEETTVQGIERRAAGQEKPPSVIGFVHAPQNETVDGVMVTIAHTERGGDRPVARPWGFVSEVKKEFGFASREEAMRGAERALLPGAAA